jgi:hypothetical protein
VGRLFRVGRDEVEVDGCAMERRGWGSRWSCPYRIVSEMMPSGLSLLQLHILGSDQSELCITDRVLVSV